MPPRDGLLLLAAFTSGAAALAYELLWTRLLALSLGSETVGVLAALAGYFGGLALGAALLHDRAHRARDPVRLFVVLELVAAGFAAVSPFLLHALARALPAWLGPVAAGGGPAALAASTAVAALVLLLGAAPLGASLAALVEARRRGCPFDHGGRGLGRIYAANTLGAALAALAAVHLLFPALGYPPAALVAAGCGALAALAARRWGRGRDLGEPPPEDAAPVVDASRDPDPDLLQEPWLLYLMAFGLGLTGIGVQVVGLRILGQNLENTIYTFAHMVAVYLLASSLGAFVYQRLAARAVAGRPAIVTAAMTWALGLLIVVAALALQASPAALANTTTPAQGFVAELAVAALVFVPGAFLTGALLSHVLGLVSAAGRGVGRVYALNSLGCAVAPFVFGLWAIPALGYADALYLVLYTYLGLFAVFGWFRRFSPVSLISGVLAGVALTAAGPRSLALVPAGEGWTRVKEKETLYGFVAVSEQARQGGPPLRRLQVGKNFRMGGHGPGGRAYGEQRMGQLCALVAHAAGPEGPIQKALYLGLGTGSTMGGGLTVPHAAAEGVELIPEVIELLPFFSTINHDLAERREVRREGAATGRDVPIAARTTLRSADARRYLAASPDTYDLIVADLFHPGQDGASALFSREHFAAARRHLAPRGVMCQWLPLYQLEEDAVRSVVRAYLDVFPGAHAFIGLYNAQHPTLALVGAADELRLDVGVLVADTRGSDIVADARDLLASHVLGPDELAAWAGDAAPNTDLDPQITFSAARVAYGDDTRLGARNLAAILGRTVAFPRERLAGADAGRVADAAASYTEAARTHLRAEVARGELADFSVLSRETAEMYLRAYELDPDFDPSRGRLFEIVRDNPTLADEILPRMLRRTPDARRVYEVYLGHLRRIGDERTFEQLRQEAAEKFPDGP